MSDDRNNAIVEACTQACDTLAREIVAFGAGQIYLLELNVAALDGRSPIKEAYDKFMKSLGSGYKSPYDYFVGRSFISLVASFELFLQDVIVAVVSVNPKKIGQLEFKLTEILDSTGIDDLVRRGIELTLYKLMYKKPAEYLHEVASLLSIDKTPLLPQWRKFIEAKARRDLGVHNGWRCNTIYLRKVSEVGLKPTIGEGDSAFPREREYLQSVRDALFELAILVRNSVIQKYTRSGEERGLPD